MKLVFMVILGLSATNGAVIKDSLPAPRVRKVITFDPAGIRLQWEPVEGSKDDPIAGYRMKVWELSKKVFSIEHDEDGQSKIIEKTVPIKDRWSFDYTKSEPKWVVNVGPNATEAEVNDVIFDIFYELRVQAFTKNQEGPFSEWSRLAIKSS